MIQFTDSTATGRRIGEIAGRNLKKLSLELGGKNSLIILDDADPDLAAVNLAWATYLHQGQIRMSSGLILVQEGIYDALLERLIHKAISLPVGNPSGGQVALGPIISQKQLEHVQSIVADSVAAGVKRLAGEDASNLFYKPTVLAEVKQGMHAFEEEIFGPVAVLTRFSKDEEAVELANQTAYIGRRDIKVGGQSDGARLPTQCRPTSHQ
jgi:benzaldehyde dehydrogenase (NAD)